MVESKDEDLMKAYVLGDRDAFDQLYSRYEKRIFAFLLGRLSTQYKQVAADLFQSVWLKIHQSRHSFDHQKKFSTWAFTITLNTIRDYMRSTKSNTVSLLEKSDDSIEIEDGAGNPESLTLAKESFEVIQKLLETLSPEYREAILLVDLEGFSNVEAANILGISDQNFRKQLSRARKALNQLMADGGHK